ncbi:MAG: nucleoside deaminase [Flavobacteriales bacterium]|nr:nucleoside deaminase [Flavobacteriales bacterium]
MAIKLLRFILFIALLFAAYVLVRWGHRLRASYQPTPEHVAVLRQLGKEAIDSGDVPVAAVLLQGDRIIGRGRNTVLRDADAGGHAEVNAVSDAMRQLGHEGFRALNRDSLVLITTYEPCAMCRGMLLEYGIRQVRYIEPKSIGHWLRDDARWLRYELTKQRSGPEGLQDSLFRMHPGYPGR